MLEAVVLEIERVGVKLLLYASLKTQINDLNNLFSSRSSYPEAAGENLSPKSRVTSYKDALVSSLPHQLPRSMNTSKNPRNTPVSSCTPTAASAVAVASTVGNIGSADLLGSPDNTAEDDFIAVSKKKRGNPKAVKTDDNAKSVHKAKTPIIGACNTSILPVVSRHVKTKALFFS
jgi:hypothetical protein